MKAWLDGHRDRLVGLLGLAGLWIADIAQVVGAGELSNGFWLLSAAQAFHLGMWLAIAVCVYLVLVGDRR